jgi:hypothetical protein
VTDYQIQYRVTTSTAWAYFTDAVSSTPSTVVTGLLPGKSYVFRVLARNAAGTGAVSASSAAVTPRA